MSTSEAPLSLAALLIIQSMTLTPSSLRSKLMEALATSNTLARHLLAPPRVDVSGLKGI